MSEIERYADRAMFPAAPMPDLLPRVNLIWMSPDPLGAIAAMSAMYEGKVIRSLLDLGPGDRERYWEAMTKTHLNAPLEAVKLHFMIEGVDRAFTHQMVRQRTAVYAQESLRFAVKEDLAAETPTPPSFQDPRVVTSPSKGNDLLDIWNGALKQIEQAYKALIAAGVPAEDARGLLPTAVLTRLHYVTDLRNLLEHAGNRLCTQAQFHWRTVFMQIREQIRNYWWQLALEDHEIVMRTFENRYPEHDDNLRNVTPLPSEDWAAARYQKWQFDLIADTAFRPQCYLQGRCTFKADFDRGCTIRQRVDELASKGVPSSDWGVAIKDEEWAQDPQAAWVRG